MVHAVPKVNKTFVFSSKNVSVGDDVAVNEKNKLTFYIVQQKKDEEESGDLIFKVQLYCCQTLWPPGLINGLWLFS